MPSRRNAVVIAATLDDIRHGSAVDFQAGGNVPAEISRSDYNQTSGLLSRSFARRDSAGEDKNNNKSADVAG
jgi:hypothetical protein